MATRDMSNTATHSKLKELLVEQLQDIYWAENKLVQTLPKLQQAATSQQLKNAFATHLQETKTHVNRLEQVFNILGEQVQGKHCPAMAGIVEEGEHIISETEEGTAQRDAALILAAQKAEHYEIATYGGLAQLAKTIGMNEAKELLGQTLSEEKQTDVLLTQIAESYANVEASKEA
ncbi:ferritin-like domain-containing protein [Paraflavisolibacter sp. H34]|uniref:YciE/YciF ferroxidase family protein n=1 Tax=Huijunlia imazamoxiresistens TaxID=3127457 RepID=UPI00301A1450